MQRYLGNGRVMSLIALAVAAGLVLILVAAGVIVAAVFAAVLWGTALFAARKTSRVVTHVGHIDADGSVRRRFEHWGGEGQSMCYDLDPSDYTVRPGGEKLRSSDAAGRD